MPSAKATTQRILPVKTKCFVGSWGSSVERSLREELSTMPSTLRKLQDVVDGLKSAPSWPASSQSVNQTRADYGAFRTYYRASLKEALTSLAEKAPVVVYRDGEDWKIVARRSDTFGGSFYNEEATLPAQSLPNTFTEDEG